MWVSVFDRWRSVDVWAFVLFLDDFFLFDDVGVVFSHQLSLIFPAIVCQPWFDVGLFKLLSSFSF